MSEGKAGAGNARTERTASATMIPVVPLPLRCMADPFYDEIEFVF
jgi:hypothetical protein